MPDIGLPEILIILLVILLLFGPGRLSGAGPELGRGIREFRDAIQGKEPEPMKADETGQTADHTKPS